MEPVADTLKTRLDEQRIIADLLRAEGFLDLLTESLLGVGGRFEGCFRCCPELLSGALGPFGSPDSLVHPAARATDNREAQRTRHRRKGRGGRWVMNWLPNIANRSPW